MYMIIAFNNLYNEKLIRPGITSVVEWSLTIRYLSVYLSIYIKLGSLSLRKKPTVTVGFP